MFKIYDYSNKPSVSKSLYFLLIIIALSAQLWFIVNYPLYKDTAFVYFAVGIFGIVMWLVDFVLSIPALKQEVNAPPVTQIINTAWMEENTIIGKLPFQITGIIYAFGFVFAILFAILIGTAKQAIIGIPHFQVVNLGVGGHFVMVISALLMEDIVFFGFVPSTIAGLGRLVTLGNTIIGHIISLFVSPFIFVMYHFLVYGTADMASSIYIYIIAFMWTAWVLVMRNLIMVDTLHTTNNVTLDVARIVGFA